jgi:hypothetical protein
MFGRTTDGTQCIKISCVSGTKNRDIIAGIMSSLKAGRSVIHFLGRDEISSVLQNM